MRNYTFSCQVACDSNQQAQKHKCAQTVPAASEEALLVGVSPNIMLSLYKYFCQSITFQVTNHSVLCQWWAMYTF